MKKVNRLRKRMEQNRRYFIPSLVLLTALGTGVYGMSGADAQGGEAQSSIVEKIAEKFNLSKDDVQKVFEEERIARQKTRQENFEKRLSEAVARGELTETQKNLIIAKKAEMEKEMEARKVQQEDFGKLTDAERKAKMEEREAEMKKHREEMQAWAEENGIDMKYLIGPAGGGNGHGGPGGPDDGTGQ